MIDHVNTGKLLRLFIFLIAASLQYPLQSSAGPAYDGTVPLKQPSGTSFDARQGGDEWYNWVETREGYGISKNPLTNNWEYYLLPAGSGGDALLSQGIFSAVVGVDDPAALGIPKGLRPPRGLPLNGPSLDAQSGIPGSTGLSASPASGPDAAPVFGAKKLLVIGVDFADTAATYTPEQIQPLFFGATNSVAEYYARTSYGTVSIEPASEFHGTSSDGFIGWIRLSGNHPNTGATTGTANQQLAKDAIEAANAFINYLQYDTNGNGLIEPTELSIIVIVAGYERSYSAAYSPSVWGHRWSMWSVGYPLVDGKMIQQYAQFGERHGDHLSTIGIMAHELGHLMFSLPDLYDTDPGNGSSAGLGYFDLMASGSWGAVSGANPGSRPTQLSAWCRENLAWGAVTTLTSSPTVSFPKADGNSASIFRINTGDPNQYFLVENRQFTGYDQGFERSTGLSHGGLAIYHIDSLKTSLWPASNTVNADENDKGVDVEEANEGPLGYSMLDTEASYAYDEMFYFQGNATDFMHSTLPTSRLKNGTDSNVVITNVSAYGDTMTAAVCTEAVAYSLSPTSQSIPSSGGPGSVSVSASSAACLWTATSNVSWITFISGYPGMGSGTVGYFVAQNPVANPRTGIVMIAGQTFAVSQDAAPGGTPVPNDACSDAKEITGASYTDTLDPVAATTGINDPVVTCGNGSRNNSVWYKFTATQNGTLMVDTQGSNYDTILSAYTGVCGTMASIDCNDDTSPGVQSSLSVPVTAGTTYYFIASAYGGAGTVLTVNASFAPDGGGGCAEPVSPSANLQDNGAGVNDLGEVVWTEWDASGNPQIYSNTRGRLTSDSTEHKNPSLNNRGDVVWEQNYNIYGIISGQVRQLTSSGNARGPSINDKQEVVWSQMSGTSYQIYSNQRGWLTSDATDHYEPAINNAGDVVWSQMDVTGLQIYELAAGSGTSVQLTSNPGNHMSPSISNSGEVVWMEGMSGSIRIHSSVRGQLTFDGCPSGIDHILPSVNACGDVTFTDRGAGAAGAQAYRLGNASPCVADAGSNDLQSLATLVSGNSTTLGMVQEPGDGVDWYKFTANAGDQIKMTVNWAPTAPPNGLTAELVKNDSIPISSATGTTPLVLDHTALYSGEHYVKISAAAESRIGYALSVDIAAITPVSIATLAPVVASPQYMGTPVTFTVTATGGSGTYQYKFLYKLSTAPTWSIGLAYSSSNTWTWNTTGMAAGSYQIQVWARNAGSTAAYEAVKTVGYTLKSPAATGATLSASPASPRTVGTLVTFTALGSGGTGSYEYKFLYKLSTAPTWSTGRAYSATNTWTWTTGSLPAGSYTIQVWVRSTGSTANYEVVKTIGYTLKAPPATGVTITPDLASPAMVGAGIIFSALASGGSGTYQYQFLYKKSTDPTWSTGQGYSLSNTWLWETGSLTTGSYLIQVRVRNTGSTASYEVLKTVGYTLK